MEARRAGDGRDDQTTLRQLGRVAGEIAAGFGIDRGEALDRRSRRHRVTGSAPRLDVYVSDAHTTSATASSITADRAPPDAASSARI